MGGSCERMGNEYLQSDQVPRQWREKESRTTENSMGGRRNEISGNSGW